MDINSFLKEISNLLVLDMTLLRIILPLFFILIGLLFRQIILKGIIKLLLHLAKKTKSDLDDMLVFAFERPAKVLILGIILWLSLSVTGLPMAIQGFLNLLLRSYFIIILFWFLYRSSDSVIWILQRFINKSDKNKKSNPVLIGLLRKSIKVIIVIMEIFMLIKELGYDVSGLVAGLGIGGLAFSLAAKDAVSNFLGSITIMFDKTYSIGDWVQTEKAEGTVEEIGFRSTKLRTFSEAIINVPNSIMSNEPVINWSRMGKRRVNYTLQIPLNTPSEKIEALLSRIKEMLKLHGDINQDMIVVNLRGFGEATLEILIYFFTKTTSWVTYLKVSEDVNLKVIRIFGDIGVPIIPPHRMIVENRQPDLG